MLAYLRNHWIAALLSVMFASSQIFTLQKSEQIDQNTKTGKEQQIVFNKATCAIRDSANEQLAAIEKLRAATDAALDVASSSAQPGARTDFRKLSQDVSNIAIKPVEVPPDIVCNVNEAATSQERLDRH